MLMSTLVTFIVALGIFLVYLTWRNTALETTDDALLFLNQENEVWSTALRCRRLSLCLSQACVLSAACSEYCGSVPSRASDGGNVLFNRVRAV